MWPSAASSSSRSSGITTLGSASNPARSQEVERCVSARSRNGVPAAMCRNVVSPPRTRNPNGVSPCAVRPALLISATRDSDNGRRSGAQGIGSTRRHGYA